MQTTTIPHTDLEVSRVAFGFMSTAANPTYDGIPDDEAVKTIHAAIDAGINFFDNAPAYGNGHAEEQLGHAIHDRRDRVVIATKASGQTLSADEITADCEASLKRLRTDVIDLHQIHWPRRQVPLDESIRALEDLRASGKVRHLGVCNFGPRDLSELFELATPCTNQVAYSLLARGVEIDTAPLCHERGVGLLCYSPMAQGLLAGKYKHADDVPDERARTRHFAPSRPQARHTDPGCEQETFDAVERVAAVAERLSVPMAQLALAWCLHQPGVTAVLVGASKISQVNGNAAAAEIELDDATVAELDDATRAVKEAMGASLDMWATPARTR
ncbi:MAG: aldo/keto reductase [Planctomycetota bacterium]